MFDINFTTDIFKKGGVVVYPTDTVYGIGCVYDNKDAIKLVYRLKQRDANKPLPLLLVPELLPLVTDKVDERILKLTEKYWPGALTILVKKNKFVSDLITCGHDTVAVRCPGNAELLKVIRNVGKPIIGTSANLSGEPSITDYNTAFSVFNGKVDLIAEGECKENISSTILDLSGDNLKILREGPITLDNLLKTINS